MTFVPGARGRVFTAPFDWDCADVTRRSNEKRVRFREFEDIASSLRDFDRFLSSYPALEALGYNTSPLRGCSDFRLQN